MSAHSTGGFHTDSLCWNCQNAVPNYEGNRARGCSWSRNYKPVKGWDATPVRMKAGSARGVPHYVDSYKVNSCPKFVPDKR